MENIFTRRGGWLKECRVLGIKFTRWIVEQQSFSNHGDYVLGCGLHLPFFWWRFLAAARVNSVPQSGQVAFVAWPDFSRWCLKRLLNVEKLRPLHPCSQHCSLGRLTIWTLGAVSCCYICWVTDNSGSAVDIVLALIISGTCFWYNWPCGWRLL